MLFILIIFVFFYVGTDRKEEDGIRERDVGGTIERGKRDDKEIGG